MLRREIPTSVFIAIVILVLIVAAAIIWRKAGGRGEVVLEKAEKPYPVPPIFQKQSPR
ncbi:MAG: hypothetical protein QW795_09030 [Candidatus Bathyarchaeia archaeon]